MNIEMGKVSSSRSIGSVRNLFIGSMIISSLSTILLITTLPIMLCRLDALYENVSTEKLAFHRAANSLDEQIEFLLEPIPMRKQRLVRQVDFLAKLERKSFKGRMRMMGKTMESDRALPPAQFDKTQYLQPSLQIFDRQVPQHTSQMRQHILAQLRALSPPIQSPVQQSNIHTTTLKYNPKCPQGLKGAKGRDGEKGLRGLDGLAGIPGISVRRYGQKGNCVICPMGPQGIRGVPGRRGMPGFIGRSAPQPNQGEPGEMGDVGEPGANGIGGLDGGPGQNGIRYTQGLPGLKGEPGNRGDIGDPGFDGIDGEYQVGDPGDMGFEGLQGLSGKDGEPGDIGEQGESPKYCDCPSRSPHVASTVMSDKVVSYYPYYRIF